MIHELEELWVHGEPTEYCDEVYTEGDCWALAWFIHELTSKPIVLSGTREDWVHITVHVGHNQYLDIRGLNTRRTVVDWFCASGVLTVLREKETVDFDTYQRVIDTNWVFLDDKEQTRLVAGLIVDKYLRGAS